MSPELLKFFRTIQVEFPLLQDAKFAVQKAYRRLFNKMHEHDFELLTYIETQPGDVFVDIGANRGDAIQSILAKKPTVKVVAFEPNPLLVEKIKNEFPNDKRLTIHNCGLGWEQNSFLLFVPFYNRYMFDGLASFKRENAEGWLRDRLLNFNEKKLEIRQLQCTIERLDSFNLAPKFIKIDVQGFEYEVLIGGLETLKRHHPIILIESPHEGELELLTELDYEPFIYKDGKMLRGTDNYNVFFIPKEKIHALAPAVMSAHEVTVSA